MDRFLSQTSNQQGLSRYIEFLRKAYNSELTSTSLVKKGLQRKTKKHQLDYTMVHYIDNLLSSLLDSLDDTMVIVTSNHGEFLGEKNLRAHDMNRLYDETTHVPLLIIHPSLNSKRIEGMVSLKQIYQLILDSAENGSPSEIEPLDFVTSEFVEMNQNIPSVNKELFRELNIRSACVRCKDEKYHILSDGRWQKRKRHGTLNMKGTGSKR